MFNNKQVNIKDLLSKFSVNSTLSCLKIFEMIKDNSLSPDEAVSAIDMAKIKINACQMGLFGYPGGKNIPHADTVSEALKDQINSNLENGKLPCIKAWKIAEVLNIKKIDVSSACDVLKIKISKCQLNAF